MLKTEWEIDHNPIRKNRLADELLARQDRFTKDRQEEKLLQIVKTYGPSHQVDKAIEEMAELVKALLKFKDSSCGYASEDYAKLWHNVIEEIADVYVVLLQMEMIFRCEIQVSTMIEAKIDRQIKRLEETEG